MSIKKSCDVCKKEFTDRDECVDASLSTENISGYDSGHKKYDLCEDCGRKINDVLEKLQQVKMGVNSSKKKKSNPCPPFLIKKNNNRKKYKKKKIVRNEEPVITKEGDRPGLSPKKLFPPGHRYY